MKISYGREVDILRIVFAETLVDESDETKPRVILDYDSNGKIIGMEILDASKCTEGTHKVEFAVVA